jgi:hypothetical protein
MNVRTTLLDETSDPDAPRGSRPWCRHYTNLAKYARDNLQSNARGLGVLLMILEKEQAWKVLGYASHSLFCLKECNLTSEEVEAISRPDVSPAKTLGEILATIRDPKPGSMTKAARDEEELDR